MPRDDATPATSGHATGGIAPTVEAAPAPPTADLGRYNALRPHARGGLGEVFTATDTELNRTVAVKRLQDRHADDPTSRRRFLAEAEITARLEHPGVVPVHGLVADGDGRPCYAMRFVEGQTLQDAIRQYHAADRPDALAFRRLLQAFIAVCQTVAYAHSRGVVHRDLKPANVMLGKYGETLVVDWGLAKSVGRSPEARAVGGESTLAPTTAGSGSETQLGSAVGTPGYMSPEQALGRWDAVGAASDVYSLGATLYALLTGRPPFADGDWLALQQKIVQGDFPRPRQVKPDAPRALEAVCLRAMALKPEDRYPSAQALAADVEQWLGDEPVGAWREPWGVRAWRWVRRHRTAVTAAAALLLTAVAGFAAGLVAVERERGRTVQAQQATSNALEALKVEQGKTQEALAAEQRRRKQARNALEEMTSWMVEDHLTRQPTVTEGQKAFLKKALLSYEEFAADTGQDSEARAGVAQAHDRVGWIRRLLADLSGAEAAFRRAIEVYERLVAEYPAEPKYREALATSHNELGRVFVDASRWSEAEGAFRRAVELFEKLRDEYPFEPRYHHYLSRYSGNLSITLASLGKRPEAEATFQQALEPLEKLVTEYPANPEYRYSLALGLVNRGRRSTGSDKAKAEADYRRALVLFEKLMADGNTFHELRMNFASTHRSLGLLLMNFPDRSAEGEAILRRAVELHEKLVAEYPAMPGHRQNLASCLYVLGMKQSLVGKWAEAEAALRQAIELWEKLLADNPTVLDHRAELALVFRELGWLLADLGRWPEVEVAYRRAIEHGEKLVAEHPTIPRYRSTLTSNYARLGSALAKLDRPAEAEAIFWRVIEVYEKPPISAGEAILCFCYSHVGDSLRDRGEAEASLAWYAKAVSSCELALTREPQSRTYHMLLRKTHQGRAEALTRLDRHAEAVKDWDSAIDLDDGPRRPRFRLRRAECLARTGDAAGAAADAAKAVAEADALATDPAAKPDALFECAGAFALASAAASDTATKAEAHAARAVGLLRRAAVGGFPNSSRIMKDAEFAPLRRRTDFADLLWNLADGLRETP